MNRPDQIRSHFATATFGAPCLPDVVAKAETALGVSLPTSLTDLYRLFDGFRGPGNAQYLFPLLNCSDGGSSLRDMTLFFRTWELVDLSRFIFFGNSTADETWGINLDDPTKIIAYHHHMEGEYEIAGADILQVYFDDEKKFLEIGG